MHRILKLRHWTRGKESLGGGRVSSVKLALILTLGLLVAGGLIGFFLRSRVATPTPDYLGTGVVVSLLPPPSTLHATRPVIIIHHDPVPGLMEEAMSMPFIAASTKLFEGLRPGDRIAFGLKTTPEALLVVSLERLDGGVGR
ncbi:MAG TPA: copper-binding protein [Candidatus Methylomirabilis sp.]|jgi:hypothetical protein